MRLKHSHLVRILAIILLSGCLSIGDAKLQTKTSTVHADMPIQHIVFILKENHSFDSYFGLFPGANGATTGQIKIKGVQQTIPLGPFEDVPAYDYTHEWTNAHIAYDNGAMDMFNEGKCSKPPYPCYQVAQQSNIPNYWAYAQNYLLNDNTFSELEAGSFPNHMYTIAAASGPDVDHSAISSPIGGNGGWGCDSSPGAYVKLYNGTTQYPCFSITTLADEMTAAGISWKFYAPQKNQAGYNWNTLDAFQQDREGPSWSKDVPSQNFVTDAANNALPAFSWLVPPGPLNEHPGGGRSVCAGENWTVQQINAVMNSPAWSSTVIVITWDDYGGFYDQVAPQSVDSLGYGFRVPLLLISPYAYATDNSANPHISHAQMGFASILKLAEEVFNLPSLNKRDSIAGDLMTDLDFSQVHNPPMILQQRTCT
ncbi:MAG TPA: alkaline phosphatase family protein [Ktedonobacteraceae bacterium]|nr:alkaline phosphatase family protein [Ktedonobacteraceae bacterium]